MLPPRGLSRCRCSTGSPNPPAPPCTALYRGVTVLWQRWQRHGHGAWAPRYAVKGSRPATRMTAAASPGSTTRLAHHLQPVCPFLMLFSNGATWLPQVRHWLRQGIITP